MFASSSLMQECVETTASSGGNSITTILQNVCVFLSIASLLAMLLVYVLITFRSYDILGIFDKTHDETLAHKYKVLTQKYKKLDKKHKELKREHLMLKNAYDELNEDFSDFSVKAISSLAEEKSKKY